MANLQDKMQGLIKESLAEQGLSIYIKSLEKRVNKLQNALQQAVVEIERQQELINNLQK